MHAYIQKETWKMVVAAAMPDEKRRAAAPCSRWLSVLSATSA